MSLRKGFFSGFYGEFPGIIWNKTLPAGVSLAFNLRKTKIKINPTLLWRPLPKKRSKIKFAIPNMLILDIILIFDGNFHNIIIWIRTFQLACSCKIRIIFILKYWCFLFYITYFYYHIWILFLFLFVTFSLPISILRVK